MKVFIASVKYVKNYIKNVKGVCEVSTAKYIKGVGWVSTAKKSKAWVG